MSEGGLQDAKDRGILPAAIDKTSFSVHTINVELEWDERKYKINKLKHGISFDEAVEAFDDPAAVLLPDVRHSTAHEKRVILIGRVIDGILIVIHTIRQPGNRVRIISARRANYKERRFYATQGS